MEVLKFNLVLMVMLLFLYGTYAASDLRKVSRKTYIIHMDKSNKPAPFATHLEWYDSSLKSVSESADMLYTYETAIHGFSTRLTAEEAESLKSKPGILSVLPDEIYELHTTRTPEFLGLGKVEATLAGSDAESQVIIGVLDTGVWPELKSFIDTGLGPVPSSWKGSCEVSKNFSSSSCNRKLIGARFFLKGFEAEEGSIDGTTESKSPRDVHGHGTHTSTTAAGSAVSGASLFGYARGTARGMATKARVATYKVCWFGRCYNSDAVAAIDKAVADGVHVLSMSFGGSGGSEYYQDSILIAAFTAMTKGVFVSCSAGNFGPLSYVAPWMITVGAGTLDRNFPSNIRLGNGRSYTGLSVFSGKPFSNSLFPAVHAANVSVRGSDFQELCFNGSLISNKVAGKIVVCDSGGVSRAEKSLEVLRAGGIGMILTNGDLEGEQLFADAHFLPTAVVGQKPGDAIKKYVISNRKPTVSISFGGTQLGVQPSPMVAIFSARGPNQVTPQVLKPDLIAPGVNVLAGWTGAVGPTRLSNDKRRVPFSLDSGTSMACPHVSGLAALLKAAHPNWSPGAIRSALMTTAYTTYKNGKPILDVATGKPATPFDFGAGHVNPVAALDPGLVYDTSVNDYIDFFCALNYTASEITKILQRKITCDRRKKYSLGNFNYPSFSLSLKASSGKGIGAKNITEKHTRTLSNVGNPGTYRVSVSSDDPAVKISVEPTSVIFSKQNEKKNFTVTFVVSAMRSGTEKFGRLVWSCCRQPNCFEVDIVICHQKSCARNQISGCNFSSSVLF